MNTGSPHVRFPVGTVLFEEGDPPGPAYLIERGAVAVSVQREGQWRRLARLGPGDLLGEMAVIDGSVRTARAEVVEDAELLLLDAGRLRERLAAADPIMRALVESQLRRYRGVLGADGVDAAEGVDAAASAALSPGIARMRLEALLRDALAGRDERNRLSLYLQPIHDLAAGATRGYEALVRWTHPERGPVSPAEFIALAEETSLIVPVGEYVLDAALSALTALHGGGAARPFVAINVSARQLGEAGLIERIVARTDAAGLPTASIKVEITESQMLDYPVVADAIARCHAHGITVSLDDFGTGYSNLAHLHELAFDTVKIDQAFARNMFASERAMAILRAMVAMVHDLGADVVVEGIEQPRQLDVLRELRVRYAQGYHIGRPRPLQDVLSGA